MLKAVVASLLVHALRVFRILVFMWAQGERCQAICTTFLPCVGSMPNQALPSASVARAR